jgi:hypothetical protein
MERPVSKSDKDRWEDLLSAAMVRKINTIPVGERIRLLPAYVYGTELAAEHPATGDDVNPKHAQAIVERHGDAKLFRDMFDPDEPFWSSWVLNVATSIAMRHLRHKGDVFRRYCGDFVDPNDALGYAFDALLKLGERMRNEAEEEVRKPYGYLLTLAKRTIDQDVQHNAIRHNEPWFQRYYKLWLKYRKEIELADPTKNEYEIENEAAKRATKDLSTLSGWLYRVDPEQGETVPSDLDISAFIEGKLMLDLMEELLQASRFSDIDRDTWARWRAMEFKGSDINWKAAGIKPSTGAQRLHALLRKLRELLSDLGYDA